MRWITPTVFLLIAIGVFVWYVNPTYSDVQELQAQRATLDEALNRSQELIAVRDELLLTYNTFSSVDLDRLEKLLPRHVDNVRLIIDIDTVASRYGMVLQDVSVSRVTGDEELASAEDAIGIVELSFRVASSYEDFVAFLMDLEDSLRLVDVTDVTFTTTDDSSIASYDVSLQTYWLR